MSHVIRRAAVVGFLLALCGCALTREVPQDSLALTGRVGSPHTWTAAQLKLQFAGEVKTIKYTLKGVDHQAQALPLLALVTAGGPALDPTVKNDFLRFVVVVQGRDGYLASFALAELMPDAGNRQAWIALDVDDQPLPDRDAPASLIIPGDQKPARWVHGIRYIQVIRLRPQD